VSFHVGAGETLLVWGANGIGKTTLLSILGGLDVPTRGSVVLGGREIARLKESELAKVRLHDVGFVFQTHNLIDDLTVEENVALPLRLARKPADARVADLLRTFDLGRLATRRPNESSVGKAQRVAVARALANGPKVILADEPTAALDTKGTAAVLAAFELARTSFHAALIVASHDAVVPAWRRRRTTSRRRAEPRRVKRNSNGPPGVPRAERRCIKPLSKRGIRAACGPRIRHGSESSAS
jgi:putative ABC transport system ATP-binding protein